MNSCLDSFMVHTCPIQDVSSLPYCGFCHKMAATKGLILQAMSGDSAMNVYGVQVELRNSLGNQDKLC